MTPRNSTRQRCPSAPVEHTDMGIDYHMGGGWQGSQYPSPLRRQPLTDLTTYGLWSRLLHKCIYYYQCKNKERQQLTPSRYILTETCSSGHLIFVLLMGDTIPCMAGEVLLVTLISISVPPADLAKL